jgi:co-chaperonin GroES (HSP10)
VKFRPLHDRVVVERIDPEAKSAGGIIIPDTAQEKPSQGEIIAVGPGGRDEVGKLIPIDLMIGDRALFRATRTPRPAATMKLYRDSAQKLRMILAFPAILTAETLRRLGGLAPEVGRRVFLGLTCQK